MTPPGRRTAVVSIVLAATLAVLGVVGSVAAALAWDHSRHDRARAEAELRTDRVIDAVRDALAGLANQARRAAIDYSPDNAQVGGPVRWAADLAAARVTDPSLQTSLYAEVVSDQQRDDFVARFEREVGVPPVLTSAGSSPSVVLARGTPTNVLGIDLSASPEATAALDDVASSSLARLVSVPAQTRDLFELATGVPISVFGVADRTNPDGALDGWGLAVFLGQDLLADVQQANGGAGLRLTATAMADGSPPFEMGQVNALAPSKVASPTTESISIPGVAETFSLEVRPVDGTTPNDDAAPLILAVAVSLVCVLGALGIEALRRSRRRAFGRADVAVAELRASEQRLRALVHHAADIMAVVDDQGVITFISPSIKELYGVASDDLIGRSVSEAIFRGSDPSPIDAFAGLAPGETKRQEVTIARGQGRTLNLELTVTNLVEDSAINGFVVNAHDVTDRRAYEDLLTHQALHDPLTGLPNRSRMIEVLAAARRSARSGEDSFAVLFIDLDGFKRVNDQWGHDTGDVVLQLVTERLRGAVRQGDTPLRVGGDEFMVVCPAATGVDGDRVARRVIEAIEAPYAVADHVVEIGVSVGVAIGDGASADLDEVVREADRAMYRHKTSGGRTPR